MFGGLCTISAAWGCRRGLPGHETVKRATSCGRQHVWPLAELGGRGPRQVFPQHPLLGPPQVSGRGWGWEAAGLDAGLGRLAPGRGCWGCWGGGVRAERGAGETEPSGVREPVRTLTPALLAARDLGRVAALAREPRYPHLQSKGMRFQPTDAGFLLVVVTKFPPGVALPRPDKRRGQERSGILESGRPGFESERGNVGLSVLHCRTDIGTAPASSGCLEGGWIRECT